MGKSSTKKDIASKADRKFEKKVQFYSKVRDTVASLGATKAIAKKKKQRSRRQKLKAFDLSALSEFLPELKEKEKEKEKENLKVNCKNRTKIMVEEAKRMNEFHKDPEFQKDPFAFINGLLKNMYPEEEKVKKNVKKDGKKKRKKKKKSSASGAPLAMEV